MYIHQVQSSYKMKKRIIEINCMNKPDALSITLSKTRSEKRQHLYLPLIKPRNINHF